MTSDSGASPDSAEDMELARPLHVLLVDDDPCFARVVVQDFVRSGLAVTVARTLADARMFLRKNPDDLDVVLLDLCLPDGHGESLLPDIEACSPQPAVIITSALLHELEPEMLEYRPAAVVKPVTTSALLRIVRTVVGGYARFVIKRFARSFDLSKRETEAVALVVQGLKPKGIAGCMHCSEQAVYARLHRVCAKTGCRDYHEVVAMLFQLACQAFGHRPPDHEASCRRRSSLD